MSQYRKKHNSTTINHKSFTRSDLSYRVLTKYKSNKKFISEVAQKQHSSHGELCKTVMHCSWSIIKVKICFHNYYHCFRLCPHWSTSNECRRLSYRL